MIKEITGIKGLESKAGINVPMPKFIYIEKYGRRPEEQMEDILSAFGKKEWFLYQTDVRFHEGGILENFIMELKKHAKIGKPYEEFVLIELSDTIHMDEGFKNFLAYLKMEEPRMNFMFVMKQSKNTVQVQQCMEQYFFVKTICAEKYSVWEQLESIRDTCNRYGFEISEDAERIFRDSLEKKEWEAEENVICILNNKVCGMIYDAAVSNSESKQIVTGEMASRMISQLAKGKERKIKFGFCVEGVSYE